MTPDEIAHEVSKAIAEEPNATLQCLPYSWVLLNALQELGYDAQPLVTRAVVFGAVSDMNWNDLLETVSPVTLMDGAVDSEHANGYLQFSTAGGDPLRLPYRTLGYPHGDGGMGTYHEGGSWNGHLSILYDRMIYDLTLGQINNDELLINFDPPYTTMESDEAFESGRQPLVGIMDGMLTIYRCFPDDLTFEISNSWNRTSSFRPTLDRLLQRSVERLRNAGLESANNAG